MEDLKEADLSLALNDLIVRMGVKGAHLPNPSDSAIFGCRILTFHCVCAE